MLFAIGLLLLLTPFPSFQTTTNEKRDSTRSDVTKPSTIFTLSKPKPTAALTKQTIRPTLKPHTVNQTVLPTPVINQKPSTVNTTVTTKSKLRSAVIQTTSAPVVKATTPRGTIINKDKHTASVNQTLLTKSLSSSTVKNSKDKPSPSIVQTILSKAAVKASVAADDKDKVTVSANRTALTKAQSSSSKTIKDKLQPLVSHTVSVKLSSESELRASKDKPTGTTDVQSTSMKSASASIAKTIKNQLHPSPNNTISVKSPSGSEVRASKDKPATTGAPDVQLTSTKSASASIAKTIKDKLHSSVNQTVSVKLPSGSEARASKVKSVPTGAPNVQSTSTKSASASSARTIKNKLHPSPNNTISMKAPSASEVRASKDKPATTGAPDVQSTSTKSTSASGSKTIKDKPHLLASHPVSVKSPSGGKVRASKDKPAPTGAPDIQSTSTKSASANGTKSIKEKLQPLVNHTDSVKPNSASEVRDSKDKPATGAPEVHSTSTKSALASGAITTKEKFQPLVSRTVSVKLPSTSDGKTSKDKTVLMVVQNVQSTSTNSGPASGAKTTKNKPTASVNQTVTAKSPSTSDVKISKDGTSPSPDLSTPAKAVTASSSAADKDKVTVSGNHATVTKTATTMKANPTLSQPIKVVISNGCDSSNAKDQELTLQPGAPLVMTHKISLLPGGCTGECEAEMAALKGRVARLEREMSLLKDKCPCSGNCPDDCSGNGECEKGKCVCHQGFVGPDCKAVKGKIKEKVDTVTQQLNKDKENMQEKTTKVDHTLRKGTEGMIPKVSTTAKPDAAKAQAKQEASDKKIISIKGPLNATKTSHPTVGQVLLQHVGRKQEEVRKSKTTVLVAKKVKKTDLKIVREGAATKTTKSDQLKDEPHSNVTQSNEKKSNGTANIVTILTKGLGTNKTIAGKETLEQSKAGKIAQSSGHSKIDKVDATNVQSVDNRNTEAGKSGKEKATHGSQYVLNATITSTSHAAQVVQNKTIIHGSEVRRGKGGSGLGSVKVVNISSYSFTVTWSAPQGMFKNFTVIRREPRTADDEDDHEEFEEEALEDEKTSGVKNSTQAQVQTESTSTVAKTAVSRGKADTKRISIVVPGSVRSVEFSNLRAKTHYALQIYGTGAEKRSKIHRVTAVTGPESATEIDFSNVTESSLTVSWFKPKTTFTGFRVTYTNIVTGESYFVTVDSQQSHVVLSKLSAGTSYIISVTTIQGRSQSDALTSVITTVPAPPTHLQVTNVTDTRAVLKWTPSLGKVDRFIISYESSKTPNVTVTVMLSGNSVEHQLRGLLKGTVYTVKVLSQKDSLQSMAISTTFTTANVVKANEVGPRSAVITWRTPVVVYHSYRVTYQVAGEEKKEVILDPTVTEYKLTGLLPMSHYIVLVQGQIEGQYTSLVTTEFTTGKLRFPLPTECSQELLNGALQSGEVDIYPQGREGQAVRVYCDMETDGGGWTVFQRRMNGKTDFYRTWSEYSAGFGNLSEEFWLGNELLHTLTSVGPVSLRVDMRSGNDTAYAHYTNFSIDSEKRHYALTVSGFTGTAGDSMKYHNGRPFSTWDKDPDSLGIHCAKAYMGGWWYKNCYKTNLNGLYDINSNNQGIVWIDWKGKDSSIPFTEMKFRPSRFSPTTHG